MNRSKGAWKDVEVGWTIYEVIFDIEQREAEVERLEKQMAQPDFWNDREAAQQTIEALSGHRKWVEDWQKLDRSQSDLAILYELAEEEEDESTFAEVSEELRALDEGLGDLEFRNMLGEEEDEKDAILTIHPGAGGTEAQDWAQMLMRMYMRWIETHGFKSEVLDLLPGEEAGIKSATIEVKGRYAYGYLKAENGVHRLVRISPFDAGARRHTSFASVFVYPEADADVEIDVKDDDLRIDTYRSSGAGGQHVNKTDSAVRITHLPTKIVVQCQAERSQHKNRATAMKILMARLYRHYREEERKKREEMESDKKSIEWGSQIRSYVFQPYTLVKDHRTDEETSSVQAVMDGDIDRFIQAYLAQNSGRG